MSSVRRPVPSAIFHRPSGVPEQMKIDPDLNPARLGPATDRFLDHSGRRILSIERSWDPAAGAPVYTRAGRYTTRGWTEWTQGFQYGCALLQFDMTGGG